MHVDWLSINFYMLGRIKILNKKVEIKRESHTQEHDQACFYLFLALDEVLELH